MCPLHVLVRGRGWALLPVCLEGYTDVPQGLQKKKKKTSLFLKVAKKLIHLDTWLQMMSISALFGISLMTAVCPFDPRD